MCACKSPASRCAITVATAFPAMLLVAVVAHHVFGHGVMVPMPGADIELGSLGSWLVSVGVGDAVRRSVHHVL